MPVIYATEYHYLSREICVSSLMLPCEAFKFQDFYHEFEVSNAKRTASKNLQRQFKSQQMHTFSIIIPNSSLSCNIMDFVWF